MATEVEVEDEVETSEPDAKSATIGDVKQVVTDALESFKQFLTGDSKAEPENDSKAQPEVEEENETTRQQESRMRKEVESAIGSLHIHVDSPEKPEQKKAEPEVVPGKEPFLRRFIGLN